MVRTLFDNSRTALAFAAVVVVGAGLVAANFEGVRDRPATPPDYENAAAEIEAEPEAETSIADLAGSSETPDGWYDNSYDGSDGSEPIDDAQGFDPNPELSRDAASEDYVILEGDAPETDAYAAEDNPANY
ncbi:hypothetical protein Ga0102493_111216 [Erythrobacter litoralis]|uniref:Uncharacterized protein n=1 Tax=Erythrobacter litoralis TaxID=39960 RepID=A0A074MZG1_9SPHN|nr:hypothetical protein [Erythrobacter litoralis]AOL22243.1 hypothetical protein Ga0102493_111216 [Erythrobacter litoralis]KEO91007.1 hypothetical protein EH32_01395 [Erythrobacter litoralis]